MTALVALLTAASFAFAAPPAAGARIESLNQDFLKHLAALTGDQAVAVATVRDGYDANYKKSAPDAFIPDALAVLFPDFRAAIEAYDSGNLADAGKRFDALRQSADPFVAASATYFHARALTEQSRFEEAAALLATALADAAIERRTPYGPHLWLLRGYCEARVLNFDESSKSLLTLRDRYADAPEAVQIGARQLLLELERRQKESLGEVAGLMDYVGDRLTAADAGTKTRERQDEIIKLLDKLIEEQEKQEQQGGGGGSAKAGGNPGDGKQGGQKGQPNRPRDESKVDEGQGDIGDLHAAPKAQPGEMWGQLPPAEREKILQSIRERFPSRYRQLVEQYYRSLAEEK
ncbi:MAG: hypothetical protein ACKVS9_01645 [Phycisphaerae bacterium]